MAGALRRLGHRAVVQALDEVDEPRSRSCDVQIVLHGKANVRRTSGQSHVLWVISHPDTLDAGACDEADLVAVASRAHATRLARQTTTPVVELLQATDPARFGRRPADQRWQYPVAVVANARHVTRPIVSDALAAGLHPAVIGRGRGRGQGRELVVATHVRNDQLATVYSSIGVLLADHRPDMRRNQFVSNRLFDALACGTPIVCDANEGVTDLFGDIVATYAQPEELGELVAASLRDPVAARARAEEGKSVVLAHHTFDDRAAQLLAHLHDLGLV
jgi:glycosyltransferase involved in cell wall biosynthesis